MATSITMEASCVIDPIMFRKSRRRCAEKMACSLANNVFCKACVKAARQRLFLLEHHLQAKKYFEEDWVRHVLRRFNSRADEIAGFASSFGASSAGSASSAGLASSLGASSAGLASCLMASTGFLCAPVALAMPLARTTGPLGVAMLFRTQTHADTHAHTQTHSHTHAGEC